MMISLIVDGLELYVDVIIKPENRNLYVRCKKPNIVQITTPRGLSIEEIKKYVVPNMKAIKEALFRTETNTMHLFGREYDVLVEESDHTTIRIVGNRMHIYTVSMEDAYIRNAIYQLYAKLLEDYVRANLPRVQRELNIRFDIGVEYKDVKTYFGECMPEKHRVIFALHLAKYEPRLIESVIYHELAHFRFRDHSKEFYDYLEEHFTDYKKCQKELKHTKYNDIYD